MPWTIEYLPDDQLIHIATAGSVTTEEMLAQTDAALELQRKHDVRKFLIDYSAANIHAPLADLFNLPDYYSAHAARRQSRIAVVVAAESRQRDKFEFYEDVCRNRGYRSRVFDSADDARVWLQQ